MKHSSYLLLLGLFISQCTNPVEENFQTQFPGKPGVPSFIKEEHDYLLNQIGKIALFQDSTGYVAVKLNDLMQHHFKEEEDYVLPPLELLPLLASEELPEQSEGIILLTEKLKTQLSHMNAEHQMIKAFMDELLIAAAKDNHTEIMELAKAVHQHAQAEEEVFFPAAILIGEYLKLKSVSSQ